jgi:hypothetical protein
LPPLLDALAKGDAVNTHQSIVVNLDGVLSDTFDSAHEYSK